MKKKIAREILYVVCFAIIVGLFTVCVVSYNKLNISKSNKVQTEIQTNYSFLQEKEIQSVCFTNDKLDYTIPIEMVGDFTIDRNDLKLAGKINRDKILDGSVWSEVDTPDVLPADFKFEKGDTKFDEYGTPIKGKNFNVDDLPDLNKKNELNNIVQRMIDARESEENIAKVIREYDEWEKYAVKNKAPEKLSPEETEKINAYISNTKQSKILSNRILTEKDIYYNIKIVALTLLILLFAIRYLFYIVSWAIKTLKE